MPHLIKRVLLRSYPVLRYLLPDRHLAIPLEGGRVYLNLKESPMMFARALGLYEVEKMHAIRSFLSRGQTFVDVGSNKGEFALMAAAQAGESGRVLVFEPEPSNCEWIRKSVELSGYNQVVKLFQIALSDTKGEAELYLGSVSGHHTLLPDRAGCTGESIEVRAGTLDQVLQQSGDLAVRMIKVDVEGGEMGVLRGARRTLLENPDVILLLDIHPQLGVDAREVCHLLDGLGFGLFAMRRPFDVPAQPRADLTELLARRL